MIHQPNRSLYSGTNMTGALNFRNYSINFLKAWTNVKDAYTFKDCVFDFLLERSQTGVWAKTSGTFPTETTL